MPLTTINDLQRVTEQGSDTDQDLIFSGDNITLEDATFTGLLDICGAVSFCPITINSNYSVQEHNYFIFVNTVPVTITISNAITLEGRIIIVKDKTGNASASNIIIDGESTQLFDGSSILVINQDYGIARLICDGTNLFSW